MKTTKQYLSLISKIFVLFFGSHSVGFSQATAQFNKGDYIINLNGGFTYSKIKDLQGNCIDTWYGARFLSFINPHIALGPAISFYYIQNLSVTAINELSYTVGPIARSYFGKKTIKFLGEISIEGGRIIFRNNDSERFPIEKAFGLNGSIAPGVSFSPFDNNWSIDVLLNMRYFFREKRSNYFTYYFGCGLSLYLEKNKLNKKISFL
jgi:hypothetical protein